MTPPVPSSMSPCERVRLLEIGVRSVEEKRDPLLDVVPEELRELGVAPLGHPRRILHRLLFGRIEVDVEVLGLEDLPVELVVLDLVLAEDLGPGGRRDEEGQGEGGDGDARKREEKALPSQEETSRGTSVRPPLEHHGVSTSWAR